MSDWMAEHHLLRVPSSSNREERALTVAMDAIDRVLTLADQMDKAPDAHTRALAASIRNAVACGSDGWSDSDRAVDRVRALSDLMGKTPDALTRAWARRVRRAVGGESGG